MDPLAGAIETVPYVLLGHGIEVAYYAFAYFSGVDTFHWKANDGGSPPTGGYSAEAQTTLTIAPHEIFLSWTFSEPNEPAGWTREGQWWAYGEPKGAGGHMGGPDPTHAYSGLNVYGYNLSGDYWEIPGEENLTSPVVPCSGLSGAKLGYWRWLGVDANELDPNQQSDYAFVRARSFAGGEWGAWQDLWVNPAGGNADCRWTYHELDLAGVASSSTDFQLRWTMGPTGDAKHACGWNIDDVAIWAVRQYEGLFASPRAHVVTHGNPTSGHRGSLFYSDDERMTIGSQPNGADPEVVVDVDGTSTELNPAELHFTLEAHVAESGTYTQVIALHNWNTALFEAIDTRPAATGSDAVLTLPITTNPQRFVDPSSGAVKARLSWKAGPGAPMPYTVAIDQVLWNMCEP